MCHDRRSFLSDEKAKAAQSKEQQTKQSETVGNMLREAKEGARKSPAETPMKETVGGK